PCHLPAQLSSSITPPPPASPLFPSTTLFRSLAPAASAGRRAAVAPRGGVRPGRGARRELQPALGVALGDQHRPPGDLVGQRRRPDRKSTRLNSSHRTISYAVFCLKKKKHATK